MRRTIKQESGAGILKGYLATLISAKSITETACFSERDYHPSSRRYHSNYLSLRLKWRLSPKIRAKLKEERVGRGFRRAPRLICGTEQAKVRTNVRFSHAHISSRPPDQEPLGADVVRFDRTGIGAWIGCWIGVDRAALGHRSRSDRRTRRGVATGTTSAKKHIALSATPKPARQNEERRAGCPAPDVRLASNQSQKDGFMQKIVESI